MQAPEPAPAIQPAIAQRSASSLAIVAERKILELYGPPGVVVNEDLEIVHFRGRTGPYLEPMPGAPSFNILRLARPELHVDLRRALHAGEGATTQRVMVETRLTDDGQTRVVELEVLPVDEPDTQEPLLPGPVPRTASRSARSPRRRRRRARRPKTSGGRSWSASWR